MISRCVILCFSFVACSSKRAVVGVKSSASSFMGVSPIGANQKRYYDLLANVSVPLVVATGPAGCGKTLLACDSFAKSYMGGKMSKLVLTRPYVAVDGEELGYLPGGIQQKMEPWTRPVFDIFSQYFSSVELKKLLQMGVIEVVPLGFMRGRSFHRCMILADEMQNSSPSQMLMLLTRLGADSKMVVTGDLGQSDLKVDGNGLADLMGRLGRYPYSDISHVALDSGDVQRSVVVSRILQLYDSSSSSGSSVFK